MSTDTYTVVGMTCDHCVRAVTQAVSTIHGVTDVDVDLDSGQVTIHSADNLDQAAVDAAVVDAGYELRA